VDVEIVLKLGGCQFPFRNLEVRLLSQHLADINLGELLTQTLLVQPESV
jgi:hypothetical protein